MACVNKSEPAWPPMIRIFVFFPKELHMFSVFLQDVDHPKGCWKNGLQTL